MLNFMQTLFGGSSQQQQSTSTPTNMNPFTSALSPQLLSAFSGGPMTFTSNTQPTSTGAQQATLGTLPQMVSPTNNVNDYITNVLNGSYMPGGANGNPFLSATVNAANLPIQEALTQATGQQLPLQFAAAGQQIQGSKLGGPATSGTGPGGSSAFTNAEALATQSAANAMGANATNIANNAYNTGVGQQTAAANLQPQMVSSAVNVLQAQLLPTLLQQQGITNGLQAFQENVSSLIGFLQTISGAAMPVVGNASQSTGSATSEGSMFGNGGVGSLFSAGSNGSTPFSNIASAAGTGLSLFGL